MDISERRPLVRGFYGSYLEPALELCMKVQRIPALTDLRWVF